MSKDNVRRTWGSKYSCLLVRHCRLQGYKIYYLKANELHDKLARAYRRCLERRTGIARNGSR